jgi:hypothetical protein
MAFVAVAPRLATCKESDQHLYPGCSALVVLRSHSDGPVMDACCMLLLYRPSVGGHRAPSVGGPQRAASLAFALWGPQRAASLAFHC